MIVMIRLHKKQNGSEKYEESLIEVHGLGINTAIGMIRDATGEIDVDGTVMSLVIAPDTVSADRALAAIPRASAA